MIYGDGEYLFGMGVGPRSQCRLVEWCMVFGGGISVSVVGRFDGVWIWRVLIGDGGRIMVTV